MKAAYPVIPISKPLKSATRTLEKEVEDEFKILSEVEIEKQFAEKLSDWESGTKYSILRDNPYLSFEDSLIKGETSPGNQIPTLQDLKNHLQNIRQLSQQSGASFQFDYYEKEIIKLENEWRKINDLENSFRLKEKTKNQKLNSSRKQEKNLQNQKESFQKEILILEKLLVEKWREFFDKISSDWELQKLKELREKFLKKIKEWLNLLKKELAYLILMKY